MFIFNDDDLTTGSGPAWAQWSLCRPLPVLPPAGLLRSWHRPCCRHLSQQLQTRTLVNTTSSFCARPFQQTNICNHNGVHFYCRTFVCSAGGLLVVLFIVLLLLLGLRLGWLFVRRRCEAVVDALVHPTFLDVQSRDHVGEKPVPEGKGRRRAGVTTGRNQGGK